MGHVLIIDDQKFIRQLLTAELILAGYHVMSVGDAKSAREHLTWRQPELVLLDLYLDGGPEGFGLLEDIKSQYPDMPVIVLTAYDTFGDDPRLSRADDYVVKSFDHGRLKKSISNVLEKKPN
jgi:DNA-binding NtrC family response regulator